MPEAATTPPSEAANQFAAQSGDSPAHVQQMLDKVDGAAPATPEWAQVVPEKFRGATPEETLTRLAKSYSELEKRLGGTPVGEPQPPKNAPPVAPQTPTEGINVKTLAEEVQTFGKVSEETLKAYEAKGIPRELVQGYVEGITAIAAQTITEVHKVVGGEQTYTEMLKWAKSSLTPEEIDTFDSDVTSGDKGRILRAVRALHAAYKGGQPNVPKFVTGDSGTPEHAGSYESRAQLVEAMRDPRYKKDPAYRSQVEAKLRVTDFKLLR